MARSPGGNGDRASGSPTAGRRDMPAPGGRVPTPWQRLRRKIREVGWLYAAQLSLDRLLPQNLFTVNKLLITESDVRVQSAHCIKDAGMRIVSASDPASLRRTEAWPAHLWTAVDAGEDVAVFELAGRLIGYRTFTTGTYDRASWIRIHLPPNAVYIGYVWIAPEFRGQEFGPGTRNALARYHEARGMTLNVSSIDALNRNSRRAHVKHSGGFSGALFYIRLLGLTVARLDRTTRFGVWGRKHPLNILVDPDGSIRFAGPQ